MAKKNVMITVDEDIIKDAKEKGINVSESAQQGIFDKLSKKVITIEDSDKCASCGRVMDKATRNKLNGLMWLDNFQEWICPQCFDFGSKKIRGVPA
ncbi:hypothetical protein LCGC14_2609590 [marine sediment metagenome]|uniref:Uncharacterized protein n=1 Tax=marine sediment metagenome TaxID=412755 RepID=A0A0F9A6I2_9ZZZZ